MLSSTFAGRLADRRGRNIVIVPGMVSAALGIGLLPLALSLPLFLTSAALWGRLWLRPASQYGAAVDRVRPEQRGLALSTYFMGFDIGIGCGAVGFGFVSQNLGWEVMGPLSATLVVLGLLGLLALPRVHGDAR